MKINNRLSALFATAVILFLASSCQQPVDSAKSSEKQLTAFSFTAAANSVLTADVTGTIDQTAHTVSVTVPSGTAVTALVATFTCSDKAAVTVTSTAQTSGTTANNFTNAVVYTVTAEDGSTNMYSVTVTASGTGSGSSEINESCLNGIWVSDSIISDLEMYIALEFDVSTTIVKNYEGYTQASAIAGLSTSGAASQSYTYSGKAASLSIKGSPNGYFVLTSATTGVFDIYSIEFGHYTKKSSSGSVSNTEVFGTSYTEASDSLCESVKQLPAGTDGTAGTTGSYVLFGSWPQTIKAAGVSISATQTKTMGANTYHLGSDGYWYAKVTATPYASYKYIFADTDITTIDKGTEYYFKVEPIKWRVLEPNKLLSESILANICYYGGSEPARTLSGSKIYWNNYKYSNIRAWLNGTKNQFETDNGTAGTYDVDWSSRGFLQSAFTETACAKITTTTVDNSAASTIDANGTLTKADGIASAPYPNCTCANTSDKIYLLSELEVTNNAKYNFGAVTSNDTLRRRTVCDYARATGTEMNTSAGDSQYCGLWWLRSPHCSGCGSARGIYYDGNNFRFDYHYVSDSQVGVVPALTLAQ